jgi:hypothetical protein
VLDGVFTETRVFWWPFTGVALPSARLPSVARGAVVDAVLELAGLVALAWAWRRFEWRDRHHRRTFWRTGALGVSAPPRDRV